MSLMRIRKDRAGVHHHQVRQPEGRPPIGSTRLRRRGCCKWTLASSPGTSLTKPWARAVSPAPTGSWCGDSAAEPTKSQRRTYDRDNDRNHGPGRDHRDRFSSRKPGQPDRFGSIVGGTGVYDLNAGWVPMITSDTPGFDGSPVPVWMKLSEARKIAKALGLPLETV